jgi:hypothetical protein
LPFLDSNYVYRPGQQNIPGIPAFGGENKRWLRTNVIQRWFPEFLNGIGNLYVGVQTPVHSEVADYTSDTGGMAPTGSKTRGLLRHGKYPSRGRAMTIRGWDYRPRRVTCFFGLLLLLFWITAKTPAAAMSPLTTNKYSIFLIPFL